MAEALRIDQDIVLAMFVEREIPAFQVRGQWRVRRSDFESWIRSRIEGSVGRSDLDSIRATGSALDTKINSQPEAALSEQHLSELTERVSQEELHRRFVDALGTKVASHHPLDSKPFEVDLVSPLPQKVRIYMYNATRPPGGRPLGEHKVQLIVPGQGRGDRGTFDHSGGRIVLLAGYAAEEDVFILWDAGLYSDFAWSRNVQVKGHTIIDATAGKIATQERRLRPASGKSTVETVVAAKSRNLASAIEQRMVLTRQRLMND